MARSPILDKLDALHSAERWGFVEPGTASKHARAQVSVIDLHLALLAEVRAGRLTLTELQARLLAAKGSK